MGHNKTETRGPSERERTTTRQPSSPGTSPCSSQGCHFWLGFVFCHALFIHRASTPFRRTPDAVRSRPHREWFTHYREVSQRRPPATSSFPCSRLFFLLACLFKAIQFGYILGGGLGYLASPVPVSCCEPPPKVIVKAYLNPTPQSNTQGEERGPLP